MDTNNFYIQLAILFCVTLMVCLNHEFTGVIVLAIILLTRWFREMFKED